MGWTVDRHQMHTLGRCQTPDTALTLAWKYVCVHGEMKCMRPETSGGDSWWCRSQWHGQVVNALSLMGIRMPDHSCRLAFAHYLPISPLGH